MTNNPGPGVPQQPTHAPPPMGTPQGGGGQRAILWGGVAAVIVAAVVIGVLLAGGDSADNDSATSDSTDTTAGDNGAEPPDRVGVIEVGSAETIGPDLPRHDPTLSPDPAVGTAAPDIRAQSMWTAEVIDVKADEGGVKVIGFFAHWCPHCQREVPNVVAWYNANGLPDGVEILAISTSVDDGAPNYPPTTWFEDEGWPFEVLVDTAESAVARGYGLSGFPYWVVVDPAGNVVERVSGEMTSTQFSAFIARAEAAA